ncbi:MAG: hypothetical protein KDD70_18915 [Bdellovibrionales bacterium]|nr:hypothetical protein [Bdellovibrionales bacterium]
MVDSKFDNLDGSFVPEDCRSIRKRLSSSLQPELIVLEWFRLQREEANGKNNFIENLSAHYREGLKHITGCPMCQEWLMASLPPEKIERQRRLAQYCCSGFFCAVEEPKESGEAKIRFSMFRGEDPCWGIGKRWSFLKFCPWCGSKLPDSPFIAEDT